MCARSLLSLVTNPVLSSYEDLKKADLEVALDEHLRANSSIFSGDKRLAEYYRRLSQPSRVSSPVKKEPKIDTTTPGDETKRPSRRRQAKAEPEATCVPIFSFVVTPAQSLL